MTLLDPQTTKPETASPLPTRLPGWAYELTLVIILLFAAYFRLAGINWGEYNYLHPDERFLIWVGSDIMPVNTPGNEIGAPPTMTNQPWRQAYQGALPDCTSWGGYFDAACSPLNPQNRGHTFYVYGTLPMFLARYFVEWIYGHSGFVEMTNVGRPLSAAADLLTVLLVYLIASRLYNRKIGLLAAAFSGAMVLQIQQGHFFTMDTFANLFAFAAIYFAIRIMLANFGGSTLPHGQADSKHEVSDIGQAEGSGQADSSSSRTGQADSQLSTTGLSYKDRLVSFATHPYFWLSISFGVALGMAVASKLNVAVIAFILPAAMLIRLPSIPAAQREDWFLHAFAYLVLAAVSSLLVFRLLQPYAFSGPGFFGLKPNPAWIANIREQRNQAAGDVDFPPALQWARRTPIWFAFKNLTIWGVGLPLGLLAWAGFLWIGWRILKGDWQRHALLWGWTAVYFLWQAPALNPTMRYFLPIYPSLAIFAAWAIFELFAWGKQTAVGFFAFIQRQGKLLAWCVGSLVLVTTYAYAFAFVSIYLRPITRVEASRWIYQNIPGPINLRVQSSAGIQNQIAPVPYSYDIRPLQPFYTSFTAVYTGTLQEVELAHVRDTQSDNFAPLQITLSYQPNGIDPLSNSTFDVEPSPAGEDLIRTLDQPIPIRQPGIYYITLRDPTGFHTFNLCGDILLYISTLNNEVIDLTIPTPTNCNLQPDQILSIPFEISTTGTVTDIYLSRLVGIDPDHGPKTLELTIENTEQTILGKASLSGMFETGSNGLGDSYTFRLDQPVELRKGQAYRLTFGLTAGSGSLQISGASIANEGEWDDGLPLRIDGYDGFGGIYPTGLNFNMYWEENSEKRERFKHILDQSEYIVITSNRQWGSLPRLPERFPMSTAYYRALLGCPAGQTIDWCYSVAQPGNFQSELGFDLVKVFQSDPSLASFSLNDQFAEEAFTVYDHPKVLIFRKNEQFSSMGMRAFLDAIDLEQVIHLTPKRAGSSPANLQFPSEQLSEQYQNGTWSELFNTNGLQNRFQVIGVLFWYLSVTLVGLLVYPMLRLALPGLPDRGYPLARIAGLLLLAWLVWMAGSSGIPFNRSTISIVLLFLAVLGGWLAYRQRAELLEEWQTRRNYFLLIEALFLGFFLLFLLVRLGNPDLWHPWKGGEKPMDFSYFNAVLKSTTFPPYDPWFAGGYLNYYYYGFVFSGVLVKWLGIVPAFAYNLILPTMFALTAIGAFSISWNLAASLQEKPVRLRSAFIAGLAGALLMTVLGNLGTLRMIFRGYQILVDPAFAQEGASLIARWSAALQGFSRVLSGAQLPYGIGDWYWNPSRVMPGGDYAITEFPAFTFIYADPHAHLFALPIALFALGWALAILLGRARWSSLLAAVSSLFLGGLAVGALRPTNTWDLPTYLAIGAIALAYTFWRYLVLEEDTFLHNSLLRPLAGLPKSSRQLLITCTAIVVFAFFSLALYQPFAQWYGQGYSQIGWWTFPVTPLGSFFTHWGLFLFIVISWMAWESIEWMAKTPASALRTIRWEIVWALLAVLVLVTGLLAFELPNLDPAQAEKIAPFGRGVGVSLVAIPLAAWAGVLLLRRDQPDAKRMVLFLIGTAMTITLVVEIVVLRGDIGRQNTVFKLYLQAWTMLAICAGAAVKWLLDAQERWSIGKSTTWLVAFILLVGSAALVPLLGSTAKIKDRMAVQAPHTLDGMAYMRYAEYDESGVLMDLSQDYAAIRWMQENVQGSPVIVEANSGRLYRWYSRFTIYTGLPGVVGWEWHQQQQRALTPADWVSRRLREIDNFYLTTDPELALQFLRKYNVRYIVLGQLERATYPTSGLDKFTALDGQYWKEVFREQDTIIYEVEAGE